MGMQIYNPSYLGSRGRKIMVQVQPQTKVQNFYLKDKLKLRQEKKD
jgi:hypothetical protein